MTKELNSSIDRWIAIGKAVERAAEVLPEGYDLHIEIERGAGIVRLYIPDTDASLSDFGGGDTFDNEINNAIDYAVAQGNNHDQAN